MCDLAKCEATLPVHCQISEIIYYRCIDPCRERGAERIIKDNLIAGGEIWFSMTMRKKSEAERWKVYSQLDSLTSTDREEITLVSV